MRTLISTFMVLALISVSGCWNTSNQGGVAPVSEEFNISVPSSVTVKQGEEAMVSISLKRGADFKRDIQMDLTADGISITPKNLLVKASDKSDMQIKIGTAKNAAIGDYPVSVKGTPSNGQAASTIFTVKVVSP